MKQSEGEVFSGEQNNPETQKQEGQETSRGTRPRTIFLAIGIGLLSTIFALLYFISDRLNSLDGSDRAIELLDTANSLTGDEFEPVETQAGDLEDWFFLKHGLEHYSVPKQFAAAKTIGCRVFQYDGTSVAQIMAVTGDAEVLFYIFPANELGVKAKAGKWKIIEGEDWAGAITGIKDNCFMIATRGSREKVSEILNATSK